MRKEKEPKKTITYTVAECSEFHELGEYHENVKTISGRAGRKKQRGKRKMLSRLHFYDTISLDYYGFR